MKEKRKHIILISLFLLLLVIPTLVQITGIEDKFIDNENRTKQDFPKINYKNPVEFAKNFKVYYKDNFGLRNTLSNNYIQFKNEVLNENPLPNKVVFGSNDFLFLGNSFSNVVEESLGFDKFTTIELHRIKNTIIERKKWLSAHNTKFYIAIAPNKHSVYKEKLPFQFPEMETRKKQLINFIKSEINFDIIDLGEQFKEKKVYERLYRKYDSHWNDLGAFYATQTLVESLKKDFDIAVLNINDYKIDSVYSEGGNSKMLNYKKLENNIILTPNFKDVSIEINHPKYYSQESINESRYKNPSKKYKVLLFRDSFSNALRPFLNHTFGETTFIWSHRFDKDLILKEKPDLVIMEYVERYLEEIEK